MCGCWSFGGGVLSGVVSTMGSLASSLALIWEAGEDGECAVLHWPDMHWSYCLCSNSLGYLQHYCRCQCWHWDQPVWKACQKEDRWTETNRGIVYLLRVQALNWLCTAASKSIPVQRCKALQWVKILLHHCAVRSSALFSCCIRTSQQGGGQDCNIALNEHDMRCVYSFYRVGHVLCNWRYACACLPNSMLFLPSVTPHGVKFSKKLC